MVNPNISSNELLYFKGAIGYARYPDSLAQLQGLEALQPLTIEERSELLLKTYYGRKPVIFIGLARAYQQYLRENSLHEPLVTPACANSLLRGMGALVHGALVLYLSPDLDTLLDYCQPTLNPQQLTLRQALETEFLNDKRNVTSCCDTNTLLLTPLLNHRASLTAIEQREQLFPAGQRSTHFYQQQVPLYLHAADQVQALTAVVKFKQPFYRDNRAAQISSPEDLELYNKIFSKCNSYSLLPYEDFFRQEAQRLTQQGLAHLLQSLITASAKRAAFMNLIYNPLPYLFKADNPSATLAGLRDYVVLHWLLRYGMEHSVGNHFFVTTQSQRLAELIEIRRQLEQERCYEHSWKNSLPRAPFAHYELAYVVWASLQESPALSLEQMQALIKSLNEPNTEVNSVLSKLKLDHSVHTLVNRVYASLSEKHPLKYAPAAATESATPANPGIGLGTLLSQFTSWLQAPPPALTPWEKANEAYQMPAALTLVSLPSSSAAPPSAYNLPNANL